MGTTALLQFLGLDDSGRVASQPARGESTPSPEGDTTRLPDLHATRTNPPRPAADSSYSFLAPPDRRGDLGRLGPYRVLKLLGEGGMGSVFLAEDDGLRRPVALKVMRPEVAARPAARERFLREGRAAAAVKSDHVVTIYQVGEANGVPYLALELLDGCCLDDWLKSHPGPVPADMVATVARDVLRGLAAAHARELVHRDVKPANLWVELSTGRVKVLDFGLTRTQADDTPLTQDGAVVGTPAYMAPEQAEGKKVDARADLWSLGVVLYRMASGTNPFQRDTVYATLNALSAVTPPPAATLAGLPPDLARLIDGLLSREPGNRPADAGVALAAWAPQAPPATPAGRRRALLLAPGLAASVLLTLALWNPFAARRSEPAASEGGSVNGGESPPAHVTPVDSVRITAFDITHFARVPAGVENRGLFGKTTFAARQNDLVKLNLTLSHPAYAYLIAFRPDGVVEPCYPEDEAQAPTRAAEAGYPSTAATRTKAYALSEAPGLWTFAAVVSDGPLPPFRDWEHRDRLPRLKDPAGIAGAVLVDDGTGVDQIGPLGPTRGTRGMGADIPGQGDLEKVGNALNRVTPKPVFRVVGIVATPTK